MKKILMLLAMVTLFAPLVFGMEVSGPNATKLVSGASLPTDEGPLGVEIFWKLKTAPESSWAILGTVSQPVPFPVGYSLAVPGYPAPEKVVIQVKARNTLGSRVPGDFNAPQDFPVPINTTVGCSIPGAMTIK
jgi:hypothetical protein